MSQQNLSQYDFITQHDYEAVAGPDWPSFVNFQILQILFMPKLMICC